MHPYLPTAIAIPKTGLWRDHIVHKQNWQTWKTNCAKVSAIPNPKVVLEYEIATETNPTRRSSFNKKNKVSVFYDFIQISESNAMVEPAAVKNDDTP